MRKVSKKLLTACLLFIWTLSANAQLSKFNTGPVFSEYGKHAPVPGHSVMPDMKFNIAFDVVDAAEAGEINRRFNSLARFINMNVAAGAKPENINLALVVHGKAAFDVLNSKAYNAKFGKDNANEPLVKVLSENNVKVILCGQSAAANGFELDMLADGVDVELSAMTAHALLQQQGYTLNPF